MNVFARAAVALVWLYHGLWCKLLGRCPEQAAIVAALPGLDPATSAWVLRAIGLFEIGIAGWVLSRRVPQLAALVQTAALVTMNLGGLVFGGSHIAEPGAMLVQNLSFLALVWLVARDARPALDARGTPWATGRLDDRPAGPELLFGTMYEDWAIEADVFPAGARVFCIASAGCTALALAARGHRVTAVDINPAQVEYVRARLRGAPPRAGRTEALLRRLRTLASLVGWPNPRRFLELEDTAEQLRQWDGHLGWRWLWWFLGGVFRSGVLQLVYRREFLEALPTDFADQLRNRFRRVFGRHPNRTNPYAWRLLLGEDPPGVPQRASGATIALACADAAAYLEQSPAGSFDSFSMSNILDAVGTDYRRRLFDAVRHAAAPGARVVLRSFAPASDAEAEAAARDRSMLWGSVRVLEAASL